MQLDDVRALLGALARERVEYVLVGGVAVGLHGLERPTADIDLFIRVSEENVERLKTALRSLWSDPAIEEIRREDLAGDYAVIRYGPPSGEYFIDIMSRIGSEITYDQLQFDELPLGDVRVRLATPATLYRMKRGTIRPIDHIDAARLKEKFKLEG